MGTHIPFILSKRIYEIFSSPILDNGMDIGESNKQQFVMTLDDFKAFYVAFKDKQQAEMADLTFELFKMH